MEVTWLQWYVVWHFFSLSNNYSSYYSLNMKHSATVPQSTWTHRFMRNSLSFLKTLRVYQKRLQPEYMLFIRWSKKGVCVRYEYIQLTNDQRTEDPSHQCQWLGHKVQVWQLVWMSWIIDRRNQACYWCHDCWKGFSRYTILSLSKYCDILFLFILSICYLLSARQ